MDFNEINNGILYLYSLEGELVINGIPSNIELSVSEAEEKNLLLRYLIVIPNYQNIEVNMGKFLIDTKDISLIEKGNNIYELTIFNNCHFSYGYLFEIKNNKIVNIKEE